ncbi:MAG: hypothetical protein NTV52_25560 [Acidobacteria bacterium]|nr:hypothetical protein [Acidobacteriota bacterium]
MRQPLNHFHFAAMLGVLTVPLCAESVTGSISFDGKTYPLHQAVAVTVPSPFLANALVTRIALSDAPISPDQLRSKTDILTQMKQGPIHGLTLEFSDDRAYFSLSTINSDQNGSASLSGTMEQFQFKLHSPQQVTASFKMPARSLGNLRLAIDVDFDLKVLAPPVVQQGAIKKGADAQSLASVKAYLAMRKAVQLLDLAAIRKVARFPQDFQGPDGLKFVTLMKEEEPTGIVVVEATEGAEKATLTVTGTKDGKQIRKTFDMQWKDGRWTTNNDNWEAN